MAAVLRLSHQVQLEVCVVVDGQLRSPSWRMEVPLVGGAYADPIQHAELQDQLALAIEEKVTYRTQLREAERRIDELARRRAHWWSLRST